MDARTYARRDGEEPHRQLRLRHEQRGGRRQQRSSRRRTARSRVVERRIAPARCRGQRGPRHSGPHRRQHRKGHRAFARRSGGRAVHDFRRRQSRRHEHLNADDDRRAVRAEPGRHPAPDHQSQRPALQRAEPHRAGRDLVHQLRRQEDSGVDSEAARLRSQQEVSADPQHSRRPAYRLRLGLRS